MLSYEEAAAAVTAPGERFEIEVIDVDGVPTKVFKHAPPSLREVFGTARARDDEIFLVYEDERWTFTEVMRHVDALPPCSSIATACSPAIASPSACATTPSG